MRLTPFTLWSITAGLGIGSLYAALRTTTPPHPEGSVESKALSTGREYVLAHRGRPGAPVVIALHGAGETVDDFRALSGYRLEQLAREHAFTLAYGVGIGRTFNDSRNPLPYKARKRRADDVAYLEEIVTDLRPQQGSTLLGIGYSNGAHLLLRAATDAPGLFDGIAISGASLAKGSPPPTQAVSMVQLAGTRDLLSPVEGGSPRLLSRLLGPTVQAETTAKTIADVAKADLVEHRSIPGRCPIDLTHWAGSHHHVWFYRAHGAGHTFPVPNAARARLYGRQPDLDFPHVSLFHLGALADSTSRCEGDSKSDSIAQPQPAPDASDTS